MPGASVALEYAVIWDGGCGDEDSRRQSPSKYSDLIIKCSNVLFTVHRCVVFSQVPILECREYNHQGKAYMGSYDPLLVTKMVDYLYSGDYKADTLDISTSPSFKQWVECYIECDMEWYGSEICKASTPLGRIIFHKSMHSLACYLKISGLERVAKDYFQCSLVDNMTPELFPPSIYAIYKETSYSMNFLPREIAAKNYR